MKQDGSHVALFASYLITAVSSWFSRSQLQLAPSLLLKLPLLIEPRALLCSSLELVVSSWLLATRGDECSLCESQTAQLARSARFMPTVRDSLASICRVRRHRMMRCEAGNNLADVNRNSKKQTNKNNHPEPAVIR